MKILGKFKIKNTWTSKSWFLFDRASSIR